MVLLLAGGPFQQVIATTAHQQHVLWVGSVQVLPAIHDIAIGQQNLYANGIAFYSTAMDISQCPQTLL